MMKMMVGGSDDDGLLLEQSGNLLFKTEAGEQTQETSQHFPQNQTCSKVSTRIHLIIDWLIG